MTEPDYYLAPIQPRADYRAPLRELIRDDPFGSPEGRQQQQRIHDLLLKFAAAQEKKQKGD